MESARRENRQINSTHEKGKRRAVEKMGNLTGHSFSHRTRIESVRRTLLWRDSYLVFLIAVTRRCSSVPERAACVPGNDNLSETHTVRMFF